MRINAPQIDHKAAKLGIALAGVLLLYALAARYQLLGTDGMMLIRNLVKEAGIWGLFVFVGLFTAGQLMHLPGMPFIGLAAVAFGQTHGFIYAMFGALFATNLVFLIVRSFGPAPPTYPDNRLVRRAMKKLESAPFYSVLILRLLFSTGPWVSTALAMSSVPFRTHLTASCIGIAPQVLLTVLLVDTLGAFR